MNLRLYLVCILFFLLTGCAPYNDSLYKQKSGFYAYIMGDVYGKNANLEHMPEVYTTPASCQKVVTALFALKELGVDFRYKTNLSTTHKGDTLENVVVNFSGDPTLTSEDLEELFAPISNKKVEGKILLDASAFKVPPYSRNIMVDDIGTHYSQPVYGINIDSNLIYLNILPTKIGEIANTDASSNYTVHSTVVTTEDETDVDLNWNADEIILSGVINSEDSMKLKISPHDIEHYVLKKIKVALQNLNITGQIEIVDYKNLHKLPTNSTLINTVYSEPLAELIKPSMKASNNLVFDSLYLTIIHSHNKDKVKIWRDGDAIIKASINKHFGVDMSNSLIVDGSGVSRYNRIQPKQLFMLLRKGYEMQEFVNSLPQPAEKKSTLEERKLLPNSIRAKTGSMTGITCLCGYKIDASHPKAFAIMANSFAPPLKATFEVIDMFVKDKLSE